MKVWKLEGGELPPALATEPILPEHLDFYYESFWALVDDRAVGMGVVGGIPLTAIDALAGRRGVDDPDAFERFRTLIKRMDAEWRSHSAKG